MTIYIGPTLLYCHHKERKDYCMDQTENQHLGSKNFQIVIVLLLPSRNDGQKPDRHTQT